MMFRLCLTINRRKIMKIDSKTIEEKQVASISYIGPVEDMGELIGELTGWIMSKGLVINEPPFVVYYTSPMDVAPEKMEYDVGIPFKGQVKGEGRIKIKVMPQHQVIFSIYHGPYHGVVSAYGIMMEHLFKEGGEMIGAPREIYLNSPQDVNENELLTEIQFPIVPDSCQDETRSGIEFFDIQKTPETYKIFKIGQVVMKNSKTYLKISEPYRPGLKHLAEFSHVMVFWWADKFDNAKYRTALRTHPPYATNHLAGVFATRAEYRPNPLALTTCKLIDVNEKEGIVEITGIDAFDGTPIIDLKPYTPSFDRVKEVEIPVWLSFLWPQWKGEY